MRISLIELINNNAFTCKMIYDLKVVNKKWFYKGKIPQESDKGAESVPQKKGMSTTNIRIQVIEQHNL